MTTDERVKRLEMVVAILMDALDRQGTERDGNWGYPPFKKELRELRFHLGDVDRQFAAEHDGKSFDGTVKRIEADYEAATGKDKK